MNARSRVTRRRPFRALGHGARRRRRQSVRRRTRARGSLSPNCAFRRTRARSSGERQKAERIKMSRGECARSSSHPATSAARDKRAARVGKRATRRARARARTRLVLTPSAAQVHRRLLRIQSIVGDNFYAKLQDLRVSTQKSRRAERRAKNSNFRNSPTRARARDLLKSCQTMATSLSGPIRFTSSRLVAQINTRAGAHFSSTRRRASVGAHEHQVEEQKKHSSTFVLPESTVTFARASSRLLVSRGSSSQNVAHSIRAPREQQL